VVVGILVYVPSGRTCKVHKKLMTFFRIVFILLFIIGLINLLKVGFELSSRAQVYACSEVGKGDPVDVKRMCHK
jgi:hypothetical protein